MEFKQFNVAIAIKVTGKEQLLKLVLSSNDNLSIPMHHLVNTHIKLDFPLSHILLCTLLSQSLHLLSQFQNLLRPQFIFDCLLDELMHSGKWNIYPVISFLVWIAYANLSTIETLS